MLRCLPDDDVRAVQWRFAGSRRPAAHRAGRARRRARAGRAAGGPRREALGRVDARQSGPGQGVRRRRPVGPRRRCGIRREHRRSEEPRHRPCRVRAGLGRCRRGHHDARQRARAGADPRAWHGRPARALHGSRGAGPGRGAARTVARRVRADRTPAARRRRHRRSRRQDAHRRVEARQGTRAADRQARPVHHGHGPRGLRGGGRGLRRRAHQGHRVRADREAGRRHVRRGRAGAQAGAPAGVRARPGVQRARAGQPHHRRVHGQRRRSRPQLRARRDHSTRSSAGRGSPWG